MFTINVKGKQNTKTPSLVKLELVFFKTGFNRVPKILDITGEFNDWDESTQRFDIKKKLSVEKNRAISAEIAKYQSVAEVWESENKTWTPAELSHCFDIVRKNKIEVSRRCYSVEQFIETIIQENKNRKRIKNGEVVTSSNNARNYLWLLHALRDFTIQTYKKKFQYFFFKNIDEEFVCNFAEFLKERKAKNNNVGAVRHRLVGLRAIVNKANNMGVEGVYTNIFLKVSELMSYKDVEPRTVPIECVRKVERMNRDWLTTKEKLWLDMFLFSYYAGGMPPIDACYLKKDSIKDGVIVYERMKCNRLAQPLISKKAMVILNKYRYLCYKDYALPVFTHLHVTEKQKRSRVERMCKMVNITLEKVRKHLKIEEDLTWYSARGTFITHMINVGYNPMVVAVQAGNSVAVIQKHYFALTEKDEMVERLNSVI